MSIGQYRLQIADHFAMVRNQVDIYIEEMVQSIEISEPGGKKRKVNNQALNREKEIDALNADRDQILLELSTAEKINLNRLEKMDLLELSNLNEIQMGEKLFQPFLFCFFLNEQIRLVIVSDGYLTQNQISIYQTIVKNQTYDYLMASHDDDDDDEDEDEDDDDDDEDEDEHENENGRPIEKCAKWWEILFKNKDSQTPTSDIRIDLNLIRKENNEEEINSQEVVYNPIAANLVIKCTIQQLLKIDCLRLKNFTLINPFSKNAINPEATIFIKNIDKLLISQKTHDDDDDENDYADRTVLLDENTFGNSEANFENVNFLQLKGLSMSAKSKSIETFTPFSQSLKKLVLRKSQIYFYSPEIYTHLCDLEELILDSESLAICPGPNAFKHFTNLRKLVCRCFFELDKNKHWKIPAELFVPLQNLQVLYLDLTRGSRQKANFTPNTQFFNSLINLKKLTLVLPSGFEQFNEPEMFGSLVKLEELELKIPFVKNLHPKIFKSLVNLRKLNMDFNRKIKHLDKPELFSYLVNLEELQFSFNSIKSLHQDMFASLISLKHLNMSFSDMSLLNKKFASDLFAPLINLETLDLGSCEITNLHPNLFKTLINLKSLDLQRNRLTKLDQPELFSSLLNLEWLNLHENPVSYEHPKLFDGLIKLKVCRIYQIE